MATYKRLKEPNHHPEIINRGEIRSVIETEQNLKYKATRSVQGGGPVQ
ncbi:hypothetical protein CHISP_2954 [Chitinispirillum alkaliphilum]|nr:hypothetical protein CHISP_2954 [Chitinispirillum alkaliphilum]